MKYAIDTIISAIISMMIITTSCLAHEKVLVITHSYNRPSFIEIQYKTFKKFLKDEYAFVVFNDARDEATYHEIKNICTQYGIHHIRIPQEIHGHRQHSCERCADVIQYSLKNLGFEHDGIVAIVDSDMFLIKEFSVNAYLNEYDIAGCKQTRGSKHEITYLWNGLVFMNMKTLPNKETMNFDCGHIFGLPVDVGGHLHHYFSNHPSIKIKFYDDQSFGRLPDNVAQEFKKRGYDDFIIDFVLKYPMIHGHLNDMQLHADGEFLHYRAASNWQGYSHAYHVEKEQLLMDLIEKALNRETSH